MNHNSQNYMKKISNHEIRQKQKKIEKLKNRAKFANLHKPKKTFTKSHTRRAEKCKTATKSEK